MQADDATLGRLMAAAQQGDKQAYAVLLPKVQSWLEQYFRHRVARDQQGNLVQEVMISLHRKRASYDPQRPFLPWLAAIARYRWLDHLRQHYRRSEDQLEDFDAPQQGDENAVIARLSVNRLLARLPNKQAEAIELVKIYGLSIQEASDKSGQSLSAVKVNIHRGLKRMAALVEEAE